MGAAVYGTIIVVAVIGAWHADPSALAHEALLSVLATVLVFWVAHAYAHFLAEGLPRGQLATHLVRDALAHDWPIVQSCTAPGITLGLGALGGLPDVHAMRLAMGIGVLTLWIYSLWAAKQGGRSWGQALLLATAMASLGAVIVVLEIRLG